MNLWIEAFDADATRLAQLTDQQSRVFALACANHALSTLAAYLERAVSEGQLPKERLSFLIACDRRLWEIHQNGHSGEVNQMAISLSELETDEDTPDQLVNGWIHLAWSFVNACNSLSKASVSAYAREASSLAYQAVAHVAEGAALSEHGPMSANHSVEIEGASETCKAEIAFQQACLRRIEAGEHVQQVEIQ